MVYLRPRARWARSRGRGPASSSSSRRTALGHSEACSRRTTTAEELRMTAAGPTAPAVITANRRTRTTRKSHWSSGFSLRPTRVLTEKRETLLFPPDLGIVHCWPPRGPPGSRPNRRFFRNGQCPPQTDRPRPDRCIQASFGCTRAGSPYYDRVADRKTRYSVWNVYKSAIRKIASNLIIYHILAIYAPRRVLPRF